MTPTLEQSLRDICAKHDLTSISFGLNTNQREKSAFQCVVHWDGYTSSVAPCAIEHGATIPSSLAAALATARAHRTVNHDPLLS